MEIDKIEQERKAYTKQVMKITQFTTAYRLAGLKIDEKLTTGTCIYFSCPNKITNLN